MFVVFGCVRLRVVGCLTQFGGVDCDFKVGCKMSMWNSGGNALFGSPGFGSDALGKAEEKTEGKGSPEVEKEEVEEHSGTVVTNEESEACACCCYCRARGEMLEREDNRGKRLMDLVGEKVEGSVGDIVETVVSRVRESVVSTTKECLESQKLVQGRLFRDLVMDVKDDVVGNLETLGERMEDRLRVRDELMERWWDHGRGDKCGYGQLCNKHGKVRRSREEHGRR